MQRPNKNLANTLVCVALLPEFKTRGWWRPHAVTTGRLKTVGAPTSDDCTSFVRHARRRALRYASLASNTDSRVTVSSALESLSHSVHRQHSGNRPLPGQTVASVLYCDQGQLHFVMGSTGMKSEVIYNGGHINPCRKLVFLAVMALSSNSF